MPSAIKPGDLCLLIDPLATGVQECVTVAFVPKGTWLRIAGWEGDSQIDSWLVDRDLHYEDSVSIPYADARCLIKLGEKDAKANHTRQPAKCV